MVEQNKPGGVAGPELSLPFPPNVSAEHLAWRLPWEVSLFRRGGSCCEPVGQGIHSWWTLPPPHVVMSTGVCISYFSNCCEEIDEKKDSLGSQFEGTAIHHGGEGMRRERLEAMAAGM